MRRDDLKLIWIAQGYLDSQILKNYLNSHGIDVYLFEESLGILYGFISTPLGEVELYVTPEYHSEAIRLLNRLHNNHETEE